MLKSQQVASLHTFMQVAQYTSFSLAAAALHLTTGAISQQMLQLEAQLGFSLFERHSRGVRLTEAGRILLTTVQRSYQDIEQTIHSLVPSTERKEIRLKLTPSFAFKWLVPRLEDFYRRHPEIQIQTFAEGALVDSERRDYDLAIDYGALPYPRRDAQLLMEEWLLPVMSTNYLAAHSWLQEDWANSELGSKWFYCMMQCRGRMRHATKSGTTGLTRWELPCLSGVITTSTARIWRCQLQRPEWGLQWRVLPYFQTNSIQGVWLPRLLPFEPRLATF